MKKTLHFLAGVPRSGSTVLAAILNQNPMVHTTTTSGLIQALGAFENAWSSGLLQGNDPMKMKLAEVMRDIIDSFYKDQSAPVIIDKSRAWPVAQIMSAMNHVLGRPIKIIATVRAIPDCASSFVRLAKPDNLDEFVRSSPLLGGLKESYVSLQNGYSFAPKCFLFVEYDNLLANPQAELARIHKFLELPDFEYDFNNIDGSTVREDDEKLHGLSGLHDIKSKLERQHSQNSKEVLGRHYFDFCQPEFWQTKPKTVPEIQPIDLQRAATISGNFEEGWRLAQEIEKNDPQNDRAAYNRGWYYLRQGKIQEGYQLMDRGRIVGVFGNAKPDVPTKPWDGKSKGVILLYLEGGLGDQIHQVRYAKDIAERGCKVIVACTGQLASLFIDVEGVSSVVQHEAMFGVYHDFWVAGMSAVVPLGFESKDLRGTPYITKPKVNKNEKKRIGLRWQGGVRFEHEHHKKFPYDLMFEAVKDVDAEFISLQRDEGVDACPEWITKVSLDSWEDTRRAVASCDLVITACTSVSHLAGAMGVPTWVVTPVMPYFLYAIEGNKTPYYDSFTLFRQEVFGDWSAPFHAIRSALSSGQWE